jgi:hypothetical protein
MSSADNYRTNAEDCLRMAKAAAEERDRPLWATMAQSWLRLAEHAERVVATPEQTAAEANIEGDQVECIALAPEHVVDGDNDPAAANGLAKATADSPGAAN